MWDDYFNKIMEFGFDDPRVATEFVQDFAVKNKEKYPTVYKHIFDYEGEVYFIDQKAGFEQTEEVHDRMIMPFGELDPHEVYELYIHLNLEDEFVETFSCNSERGEPFEHCGLPKCKNCNERKVNFKLIAYKDPTSYTYVSKNT
jgi:7-cyano-7-deazaguanine synthase in queuosine biosynthesis